MEGYSFDRARIELFDKQRNEIIHGTALGKPLSLFAIDDSSISYLMQTGMYLAGLVNYKYKLQIDSNFIGKLWQQT